MIRQSNIELLRLLSMFALLFLHFYTHSLLPSEVYVSQTGFWKNFPIVVSSLTSLQVNIFILISGWFGIHTTSKKIISFYLLCAFYGVLTYLLSIGIGNSFSLADFAISFMPFSAMKGWWFVKAYLFLMLLAPLFNKAIDNMSRHEFLYVLLALVLINSFFGFFFKQEINKDGHNFMQLMYVYFIGRYLALHLNVERQKLRKWTAIISICSVALYALVWLFNDNYLHFVKPSTFLLRNNVWSLFNSIVIFLFFTTIRFESKFINWLAKGAFAVYLVHESIWICSTWYSNLAHIYAENHPAIAWIIVSAIFVVYFFGVLCFDHLRIVITNPVENKLNEWCNIVIERIKNLK